MRVDGRKILDDRLVVGAETEIEPRASAKSPIISHRSITNITVRLLDGKRVRRSVPIWGRLHIDRQLPFLIVYRRPESDEDPKTGRFVMGEASYLTASGNRKLYSSLNALTKAIANTLGGLFGAFLIIEVWSGQDYEPSGDLDDYKPGFRVLTSKADAVQSTVRALEKGLSGITAKGQKADVEIVTTSKIHPPGMHRLISKVDSENLHIHHLGIEIKPVYRNVANEDEFPLIRRALHRGFARTIKQSVFKFTRDQTSHRPANYQALGPRSFVKSVWQVDEQLANVSNQFDFLLSVTPTNVDSAWAKYKRSRFQVEPNFTYRPLPVEPSLLKRQLYNIKLETVSDPVLAQLFRSQQIELDRKITMLGERNTDRFLYGSLQLYGGVDDHLSSAAEAILYTFPPRTRDESSSKTIDAKAFAKRAEMQLDEYRSLSPKLKSKVVVRADYSGLMVSRGNLLIGKSVKTPESRVNALIAHEVGTHIVTYLNGRAQPFRQLYVGLPNYDELQEGLAVLAEYFVGGLTRPRMRLLAARVIAAQSLVGGASFIDVYRLLNDRYLFEQRAAFGIAMRTFRCGGLTKDTIYLRGLINLLQYLQNDGDLNMLFIGKFGMEHLPIIKELQSRAVLQSPAMRPHYLDSPETQRRLKLLRRGATVMDLVEKNK